MLHYDNSDRKKIRDRLKTINLCGEQLQKSNSGIFENQHQRIT